jgi:putative ABC transport system substrate-binding protein
MKRRQFIAAIAALLVASRRSGAQEKLRRVGFLAAGDGSGKTLHPAELAFLDALRSRGWIEGKNLVIDSRFLLPRDRLRASVAELIALSPDVLVTSGAQGALALKSTTSTVPIVFLFVADPVRLGLVQSLSRPGGNVTDIGIMVPDDFIEKRLQILRELVPGASKIAILVNPDNPLQRLYLAEEIPRLAKKLDIVLLIAEATKADELEVAFASAAAQNADAIMDLGDALTFVEAPRIIALAAKYRLPANYLFRNYANGGLSVYGADIGDLLPAASNYVDKILRGTKPSDLPVERPTRFELVINLKTAKALGLIVPPSLILRADEVIE